MPRPPQQQPTNQFGPPQQRNNVLARPPPKASIKQGRQDPGRYPARDFPRNNNNNNNYRPRAAAYRGESKDFYEYREEQKPEEGFREGNEEGYEEGFHGNEDLCHYYPRDDHEEDLSYQPEAQAHFATTIAKPGITCRRCQAKFASNNLLHKHTSSDGLLLYVTQLGALGTGVYFFI